MIIGQSHTAKSMREFLYYADKDSRYLVGGEPGTGKSFLIRNIIEKLYSDTKQVADIVTVSKVSDFLAEKQFFVTESRALYDIGINTIKSCLWIDPLRERNIDIAELSEYFIQTEGIKTDRWYTSESMKLLTEYWWPYNTKELKRVVTTEEGYKMLPYANLSKILSSYSATEVVAIKVEGFLDELGDSIKPGEFYRLFMDSIEGTLIKAALKQCEGSITKTSQLLNIHRNTLRQKIKKFKIKN